MKLTPSLITLSALLLIPFCPAATLPAGDTYICAATPQQELPAAEYKGHLLPALQDYHWCLRMEAQGRLAPRSATKTYRHAAMDITRRFPAEVNDLLQRADGSWATPLSMAVQAQDAELVDMLLKLGALPFSPNAAYPLHELPPLPGIAPDARVNNLLHTARQRYNPLDILLKGVAPLPQRNAPSASTLTPTLRQLDETQENTYLGEPGEEDPWLLYQAFNRIPTARGSLLRLQPVSRIIVQPEENTEKGGGLYGAIITTARVVDALTGALPTCEYITWEIAHEGPISEASRHPALKDEPIFFALYPKQLEAAPLQDGHLQLGHLDSFDICYGEKWQAAFDRVLADYPEKAEPIAPTADELAAARKQLEEAPVILRADIVHYRLELDEQAGQVHVRYLATPRAPLKGALIKGALRDWGNLEYRRSFPLTDAWRQRHADYQAGKSGACENIPVILCLRPTDKAEESAWVTPAARQRMNVLHAFDAVNDAPMLRALNHLSFHPRAE